MPGGRALFMLRPEENLMHMIDRLRTYLRRTLRGLWLSRDFRKLWLSLTITSFGAQITNLALPLTAALLLHATPMQMGILVALETLPFALFSLHAGVLLDRVRKLPVVIAADVGRGLALIAIPIAAWFDALSVELLFGVGFLCGVQNVVGGAAYQVLLAQMAGRKRLVEANAKISLGETSAALIGPGIAGGLIQALTAPFAIALDAVTFFVSALMLRRLEARNDVVHGKGAASMWREIGEGLKLVWENRTLWGLAWLAGSWQFLHHMQIAVLILFATRDLSLSAGAIGIAYVFGGLGCVLASAFAERLSSRLGIGPVIVHALIVTALGWQAFGLLGGSGWVATLALRRRAGDRYRLARDAAHRRGARIGACWGGGDVVPRAVAPATAGACGRLGACRAYCRVCDGGALEAVLGAGRAAVPAHCQRPATTDCPQSAPSLRVAAKRRACGVPRLANRPSYSLRRAPCIHHRLASNAYVRASPTGS